LTRWDAFTALCEYLHAGYLGGARPAAREISWQLLIEIASFHYVTPALARCFENEPRVPDDVCEYFAAAAALNAERNEKMLAGLARVAGLLNAVAIEPMLLKGAALLAERIYPDPSMRLLGDIDILIPADRTGEALAALNAGGFTMKPAGVVPPPAHHHLQMLHDPDTGMGIELHTDVISSSADAVIATAWFCEHARPSLFCGQRILLPEASRNAGHIIFHSQIFHGRHDANQVQLRHLLDLALLRARRENAIDWDMLDHRFTAAGIRHVLASYLGFAETLFGQTPPKALQAPAEFGIVAMRRAESRDGFHLQIDSLRDRCDELQTELSHMTAARDQQRSLVDALEQRLASAQSARNELAAKIEQERAAHDRFRDEAQRLQGELEEMERRLNSTERRSAELERDLTALHGSTSWRLTEPLRRLITRLRRWSGSINVG
jgi:hypothetical protein